MKSMRWVMVACLLGAALAWGCTPPPGEKKAEKEKAKEKGDHDHDHHDAGPHGGTVVDWDKYHAEVCFDRDKKEATVYVLGSDEKTAAPIKADKLTLSVKEPVAVVELKPSPLDGEKDGKCSRYVGKDDKLGDKGPFSGTVSGVLGGKPHAADFKEEAKK